MEKIILKPKQKSKFQDDRKLNTFFTEGRSSEVFKGSDSYQKHMSEDRPTNIEAEITMIDKVLKVFVLRMNISS